METLLSRLGYGGRDVRGILMRFRLRTLLIAAVLAAHVCAKRSWVTRLCDDGSTPVTMMVPFVIQTELDGGDTAQRRTYVGACGMYHLLWTQAVPIQTTGTRYCYVPELIAVDGAELRVMIRGREAGFVHLSGIVRSDSVLDSAMEVLDEHDWAGMGRAFIDVDIVDSQTRRRFWHELRTRRKGT
jgi:hypothetical protein